MPSKFNIPERKISEGFGVDKIVEPSITIDQTLFLPHNKNMFVFEGKFPVYTDKSLTTNVNSEPVLMMPTDHDKTNQLINYPTNQRALKGPLYTLVQLPLAPEPKPEQKTKSEAIKIESGKTDK